MLRLDRRCTLILRELINTTEPLSADALASFLGSNSRTIRGDMAVINQIAGTMGAEMVSKTGSGFQLVVRDENEFRIFVDSFTQNYDLSAIPPFYNVERVNTIIHLLLFSAEPVKAEDICEALFISRTTFSATMKNVRHVLARFHLTIGHKPNQGLSVVGGEFHLRLAMAEFLFADEEVTTAFANDLRLRVDPVQCRVLLSSQLAKQQVHVSFDALQMIARYLAISDVRSGAGFAPHLEQEEFLELTDLSEYSIALEVLAALGSTGTDAEGALLALLIAARRQYELDEPFPLDVFQEHFFLADELLRWVFVHTRVNLLLANDLRLVLSRELRALLLRLRFGCEFTRPIQLKVDLQDSMYEYAVLMSEFLRSNSGFTLAEEEIANLAMLLDYTMGDDRTRRPGKNVLLILDGGQHAAHVVGRRLARVFGSLIASMRVVQFHELFDVSPGDFDLVVTDVPAIRFEFDRPVFHVRAGFNQKERAELRALLEDHALMISDFVSCLTAQRTFFSLDGGSREEVLRTLCAAIETDEKSEEELLATILARENVSSMELGSNAVVCHTLFAVGDETHVAFARLRRPLHWIEGSVQLVVVVAIGRDEQYAFTRVSQFRQLLRDVETVHGLIRGELSSVEELQDFFGRRLQASLRSGVHIVR